MPRGETYSQLDGSIRAIGDFGTSLITDAEMLFEINLSQQKVFRHIARVCPTAFTSQSTISIVSGTDTYTLPTDFFSVIRVVDITDDNIDTQFDIFPLPLGRLTEAHTGSHPRYAISGDSIIFAPKPTRSRTYLLDYVPFPQDFVGVSEPDEYMMDTFAGFGELIICDVLVKIFAGRGLDAVVWQARYDRALRDLISTLRDRTNQDSGGSIHSRIQPITRSGWYF